MALSARHERFVQEYLKDRDGAGAYLRCGYKANASTAKVNACRLLRKPEISAAIAQKEAARAQECSVAAQDVLRELCRVAFSDVGQVLDMTGASPKLKEANDIPEDARRAVQSVKVRRYLEGTGDDAREVEVTEFKFWPKVAALEQLGRHLGMLRAPEAQPVTVTVENKIKVDARTLFAEVEEYLPVFEKIARERVLAQRAAESPPEAA